MDEPGPVPITMKPAAGQPTNPYLKTKILTASPEELRLMLYEGVLRFCHQAKAALSAEKPDFETSYNNLTRAQKIVLELSTSLKPEVAPELCEKLNALYIYIYRRLVDANMNRDPGAIDEAIELLAYEKQTWEMLMQQLAQQQGQRPADQPPGVSNAQQTAISSFSVDG